MSVFFDDVINGVEAPVKRFENFVGTPPALAKGNAQGLELGPHPAHANAELQATARQFLDCRDPFRRGKGRPVGQHQHAGAQPDAFGFAGQPGEGGEGVEVTPVRALGVIGRNGHVVHHPGFVEAGFLRRDGRTSEGVGMGGFAHDP